MPRTPMRQLQSESLFQTNDILKTRINQIEMLTHEMHREPLVFHKRINNFWIDGVVPDGHL